MTSHTKVPITPRRFFRAGTGNWELGPGAERFSLPDSAPAACGEWPPFPVPCSQFPLYAIKGLLFECGHRSHDARGAAQRSGHDTTRLHRRAERAPAHLRAQRLEQWLACLCDAAGDDDDIRVEDVQQIRDARAEEVRRLAHDLS